MLANWERLVFIDFEASSLSRSVSWPIEVGAARIDGAMVRSWSSLIRPEGNWSADGWHAASAAIHGITREELQKAPSAASVADTFLAWIDGRVVVSDAPEFDLGWARRLLDTRLGAFVPLLINDFDAAVAQALPAAAMDHVYRQLDRIPAPHRAEADARRLALAVLAGLAAIGTV